jgi:radical SAM superfamily enzyme YgiQ (UPF0313 family)
MQRYRKQNTILLVNPPFYRLYKETYSSIRYPLSLGYLAGTIIEKTAWKVFVYNADFAVDSEALRMSYLSGAGFNNYLRNLKDISSRIWNEAKSTMARYEPKVVGIYCCAGNLASSQIIGKLAKKINNRTIVIMGGPHPTAVGPQMLADSNVDIVVKGEGEITTVELLDAISKGESFARIKGIMFREDQEIVETPNRKLVENLDTLCFPHQYAHEVLVDYDKHPKSAFKNILATRGCPYTCFFCGSNCIWGRKTRFRSVENVAKEIKSLQKMGINRIEFVDDTFGINKEYTHRLCDSMIHDCPKIRWGCETRVDLIDEKLLIHMKKAGCHSIFLGIESGNNEILKHVRKGITVEQALSAVKIIRNQGIKLTAFFIIGTPWETEDTLNDTFITMQKIRGLLNYSIFTPYPGTEAFDYCKKVGLIKDDYDPVLYNHQSPENCFCTNIHKERFRQLASRIEEYVDQHNTRERLLDTFSLDTLYEARNYGFRWSLKILRNLLNAHLSGQTDKD